jgi:hypothetical protein
MSSFYFLHPQDFRRFKRVFGLNPLLQIGDTCSIHRSGLSCASLHLYSNSPVSRWRCLICLPLNDSLLTSGESQASGTEFLRKSHQLSVDPSRSLVDTAQCGEYEDVILDLVCILKKRPAVPNVEMDASMSITWSA